MNPSQMLQGARQALPALARTISSTAMAATLMACCLVSIPLLVQELSALFLLDETGYGDSYILYDVLHFEKTGTIYRDLAEPPYLPAQYSPGVYVLFSISNRILRAENPFVGPRLTSIAAFVACIGIVISIVRAMIPARLVWIWAFPLVSSVSVMWAWVLQIRADFPGICFNLLAIRLLLLRSRWSIPLAGICVGLALQLKVTFIAAGLAASLWLLFHRRWKDLAAFAIVAGVCALGPYLLYSVREPRMFSQIFVLSPGIADLNGDLKLLLQAVSEPVVLLGLLGAVRVLGNGWARWNLLATFAVVSFVLAVGFDLQAGGNINYFFEALFAVIPLAVLGVLRLTALSKRNATLAFCVIGLFGVYVLAPRTLALYQSRYSEWSSESPNREFRKLENALRGKNILSTVPRLGLMNPKPVLLEPYLLSYLHRLGKTDPKPVVDRVRNSEFEAVITSARLQSWRGILHIDPELHDAIAGSYAPYCTLGHLLLHLPVSQHRPGSRLAQDFRDLGCVQIAQW